MVNEINNVPVTDDHPGGDGASTRPPKQQTAAPGPCPLSNACPDPWTWDCDDRSPEAMLLDSERTVLFHPYWSNGTAGVRGTKPLSNTLVSYWEIKISRRLFGTSLMFGVATKSARLHIDAFINLLGEDEHSWALSHKGTIWHRGRCKQFTEPFRENDSAIVGLMYDGPRGTLTYFKDGVYLGVAFTGLNGIDRPLYPAACSTAAKTEMTLYKTVRSFSSLQDRCRAAVARHLANGAASVDGLPLPRPIKLYINELLDQTSYAVTTNRNVVPTSTSARRRHPQISLKFSSDTRNTRYWPPFGWQNEVRR